MRRDDDFFYYQNTDSEIRAGLSLGGLEGRGLADVQEASIPFSSRGRM